MTVYPCEECGTTYPSTEAADRCAIEDAIEDRDTRRITRSSN